MNETTLIVPTYPNYLKSIFPRFPFHMLDPRYIYRSFAHDGTMIGETPSLSDDANGPVSLVLVSWSHLSWWSVLQDQGCKSGKLVSIRFIEVRACLSHLKAEMVVTEPNTQRETTEIPTWTLYQTWIPTPKYWPHIQMKYWTWIPKPKH